MKRYTIALLLLLVVAAPLRAQDEDMPRRSRRAHGGIVGGGISFIPTWTFLNVDGLNSQLAPGALDMPALDGSGILMLGAQLYGYIMVVPNLRLGAQWYGGSNRAEREAGGVFESTELSSASGGLLIEYVFPFKRFHVAIGGMVGIGDYTLTLTRGSAGYKSWNDPGSFSDDTRMELVNDFFAWQPAVTAEYDIHPFVVLSLTGGYYGTSGSDWEYNDAFTMHEFPDLELGGPFVRFGLTVGLFLGEW